MTNLLQRVLVGLVGIPIALVLIWAGGWWFAAAIIAISAIALWEFYHLAHAKGVATNTPLGITLGVLIQGMLAWGINGSDIERTLGIGFALLALLLGVLVVISVEMWRNRPSPTVNNAVTLMGVFYVALGLSSLLFLRGTAHGPEAGDALFDTGAALVMALFVSVWSSDTFAYFTGMSVGRHKLLERVSPKKTWEGAAGGLIGAIAGFWAISATLMPAFTITDALVCGVLVGVVGPIGDLAESWMKRDAVIKDSSHLIPGHGGVLDRFDSMLFAGPVVLAYLTITALVREWLQGAG